MAQPPKAKAAATEIAGSDNNRVTDGNANGAADRNVDNSIDIDSKEKGAIEKGAKEVFDFIATV